jgi:hypothetical protein
MGDKTAIPQCWNCGHQIKIVRPNPKGPYQVICNHCHLRGPKDMDTAGLVLMQWKLICKKMEAKDA